MEGGNLRIEGCFFSIGTLDQNLTNRKLFDESKKKKIDFQLHTSFCFQKQMTDHITTFVHHPEMSEKDVVQKIHDHAVQSRRNSIILWQINTCNTARQSWEEFIKVICIESHQHQDNVDAWCMSGIGLRIGNRGSAFDLINISGGDIYAIDLNDRTFVARVE